VRKAAYGKWYIVLAVFACV